MSVGCSCTGNIRSTVKPGSVRILRLGERIPRFPYTCCDGSEVQTPVEYRIHAYTMASGSESRRCRQKHFCGHCNDYLPKSTFYRHRDSFFNPVSNEWQRRDNAGSSSHQHAGVTGSRSGETLFNAGYSDRQQDSAIPESQSEATTISQLEGRLPVN